MRYRHAILGGTFDRLHAGHILFLRTAAEQAEQLSIGITTEPMNIQKVLSSSIETYTHRVSNVEKAMHQLGVHKKRYSYIPLHDIFGTSLTDSSIDVIIVTPETYIGASIINKKRKEIGLKPLDVISVPYVRGDDGEVISSEKIRYGDISRIGTNYAHLFFSRKILNLPDNLRESLREPFGDIIKGDLSTRSMVVNEIKRILEKKSPPVVVTIGDIVTQSLKEGKFNIPISIIDNKSRREAVNTLSDTKGTKEKKVFYRNRPGTIEYEAVAGFIELKKAYIEHGQHSTMIIHGEEDLLALPVILLSPLDSIVLYGQYNLGVIMVKVTEEIKTRVLDILNKFTY